MVRFGGARAGCALADGLLTGTALVSPAYAACYVVDTDLGTINGIGSDGSVNGSRYVVVQSVGVTQFVFNGDLNVGTFDSFTGTGSAFASFKALNNANIAAGAIFNFSGSGPTAGASGGGGGGIAVGGSAGQGAVGGQGGFANTNAAAGEPGSGVDLFNNPPGNRDAVGNTGGNGGNGQIGRGAPGIGGLAGNGGAAGTGGSDGAAGAGGGSR
jgi:hypothetical protein